MKKNKIKNIIKLLNNSENQKKKVFFFKRIRDLQKNSIIIFLKKNGELNFFLIFFICFFSKFKTQKNLFLIFNFKKIILGHNLFPQWPGVYTNQNFLFNFFKWLKLFFYLFYFKKKLLAVILRIN